MKKLPLKDEYNNFANQAMRKIDQEEYEQLREIYPSVMPIWKKAVESFPDEKLRDYFNDFHKFLDFYDKMNEHFHDEEVRFYGVMFDVCPELKSKASDSSSATEGKVEFWSRESGWV